MDDPTGGEIRRGDSYGVGPRKDDETDRPLTRADIAPTVLASIEQLAQGFDLVRGRAILKVVFDEGRFEVAWLERRVTLKSLAEFEPVFREATASAEPLPSARIVRSD
jgi:hypothetical protein